MQLKDGVNEAGNSGDVQQKKSVATRNTEPFMRKKKLLGIFGKGRHLTQKELRDGEPWMFYITEEGRVKIYKNVKPGDFRPKDKWGREKGFTNKIESRKLLRIENGDTEFKAYIHHEKEAYGYPIEAVADAESFSRVIHILQANYKEYDDSKFGKLTMKQVKTYLWLIGGLIGIVIAAIYVGQIFGVWELIGFAGEPVVSGFEENATPDGGVVVLP